jgi:hypothetical protein
VQRAEPAMARHTRARKHADDIGIDKRIAGGSIEIAFVAVIVPFCYINRLSSVRSSSVSRFITRWNTNELHRFWHFST